MPSKTPSLLSPEQRAQFGRVPHDLSDRDLARYDTFSEADLAIIKQHRRPANRLGFAAQLAVLRYPGCALTDLAAVPERLLAYLAEQVDVEPAMFARYGERQNTRYEHLEELRRTFGYQHCDWSALRDLGRTLLPLALESDRALPLLELAVEHLRTHRIIVPAVSTMERTVWTVQRIAERRVEGWLTRPLTDQHCTILDRLLHADPELHGRTRWSWLRDAPEIPSGKSLRKILERLDAVHALAVPVPDAHLHPNRLRQLARRCAQYPAQPLAKFANDRRHALLAAYVPDLATDLTDQALDMHDKLLGELLRKGERKQDQHFQVHVKALNTSLAVLTTAGEAFLTARREGLEPFATVFGAVGGEAAFAATIASAKTLVRPLDLDARDVIETQYAPVRGALLALVQTLEFRAVRGTDPALEALAYVQRLAERKRRVTARQHTIAGERVEAPLGHMTERWRRLVFQGRKHINANFYEVAAFEALRAGLRSGDLSVVGSQRYRDFESYLLPKERWAQVCTSDQTRLAITGTAEAYLEGRQRRITTLVAELQRGIGSIEGLKVDAEGELHLNALDTGVPEEVRHIQRRLDRKLPHVAFADLLNDVDRWTGWSRHLTHVSSDEAPTGERKQTLLAAVMGLGMNDGLGKLARSTPFSYRQLAWAADWHIRDETLSKAQADLNNFVLHHPLARHWGDGTRSSSDGLRVKVAVKAANAERNAAYFGAERGATISTHTADIRLPFAQKVISTNDREALHVIDALLSHETDFHLQEHAVDTNGYTTHVFALCTLLGFRFAPRIRDVLDQRLFCIGAPEDDGGPVSALLKGRSNTRLITRNWDGVLRVAASIRHGTVSAALLMRKLAAYPRQNQIAHALAEIGQIEKTVFILEYLLDPKLRQRVQRSLNNGESVNSIARVVFAGQRGEFRDRAFQDQVHRASCLHLLIAAIGAWTTPHLAAAVEALRAEGVEVLDEHVAHLSPLVWGHVNFLGTYTFDPGAARGLDNLRPLRSGIAEEDDDEEGSVAW